MPLGTLYAVISYLFATLLYFFLGFREFVNRIAGVSRDDRDKPLVTVIIEEIRITEKIDDE